jgi:hypothetical protein
MVTKTPFEHSANAALGFEEAIRNVSVPSHYSPSIFTLEINGNPTFAQGPDIVERFARNGTAAGDKSTDRPRVRTNSIRS